ncbi:MAG: hypothetical protein JXA99_15285 [Candidatus Lokiarchaeota archaeon]|nr:hypothetical protein [Candidatus Lokiarchaeota archaeon]
MSKILSKITWILGIIGILLFSILSVKLLSINSLNGIYFLLYLGLTIASCYLINFILKQYRSDENYAFDITIKLFIVLIFFLSYLITFVHESGHAFLLMIFNIPFSEFNVRVLSGEVVFSQTLNPQEALFIISAGTLSLLSASFIIIILLALNRKIKAEIFYAFFFVMGVIILNDFDYWIRGTINQFGDPWMLLEFNPSITPELLIYFTNSLRLISIIFFYFLFQIKHTQYSQRKNRFISIQLITLYHWKVLIKISQESK